MTNQGRSSKAGLHKRTVGNKLDDNTNNASVDRTPVLGGPGAEEVEEPSRNGSISSRVIPGAANTTGKTINDFRGFDLIELFGKKQLTGVDSVLLGLIRKASQK
jgi:hypothetical protein